jgi:glycosyltransferase involved in cell wall biosynthesis
MAPENIVSRLSVIVHTYERPDFLESDIREGRWSGIPLLIADDASSSQTQARLQSLAEEFDVRFTARAVNGGPSQAALHGVEFCETEFFALCGDDDYLRDFPAFAKEALELADDPETLFVAMPEVRAVSEIRPESLQFNRRAFEGTRGRDLLRELVFGGEMRALQAGTIIRSAEARPHFASSLFRTSEDFILICRLCAERPDAVVRVPEQGAYIRREHDASLSHRTNMSTERAVVNLLALLVGGRLLQTLDDLDDGVILGLIRQRAQVIATVYGAGLHSLRVIEAVLNGDEPDLATQEAREAYDFLMANQREWPRELVRLKANLASELEKSVSQIPSAEVLAQAVDALNAGNVDMARALVMQVDDRDLDEPALLSALQGQISWHDNRPEQTVRFLSEGLVHDPEHAECLHMLAQVAEAAGSDEIAARLRNRLWTNQSLGERAAGGIAYQDNVPDLKVAFIVSAGLDQFLFDLVRELLPHLDARKFVVESQEDILRALTWADVAWFEWCNDPIIWASRQDIARHKGVICRLHRYEAFSDMPLKVQWEQVDALTVVAPHLAEIVADALPGLKQRTGVVHIPNGVDMARYELVEREPGFDIALIGYLHGRKNPQMALQILHRLVQKDSRYRLHVAGKFQDPALKLYWGHQTARLGLQEHVVMYEWQDDIASFLEDKQYLLSTSLHESFGYSIAEGMARGIKPVVHHFPFASEIWAEEMLFDSLDEAVEMITSPTYTSAAYRDFVQEHYSLESQVQKVRELVDAVSKEASGDQAPLNVSQVLGLGPRMINAEVACRCPACQQLMDFQQQTISGHPVAIERCSQCGERVRVGPDVYRKALEDYANSHANADLKSLTLQVAQLAATWSEHPEWKPVLSHDGLDLAKYMEFELLPHLVQAWISSAQKQEPA